jgi:hypothetical protein
MAGKKKGPAASGFGSSGASEPESPTTSTPNREPCTPSTSRGEGDELPKVVPTLVKVHIKLQTQGKNIRLWDHAFRAANEQKGSLPAVLEAMPGTIHNSAALLLLYESISEDLHGELTGMTTAFDAYNYVFCKFNGGTNIDANNDWLKEMAARMRHDETITQYVNRMLTLKESLRGNNHSLMDEHVAIQIVQGLPAAAKDGGSLSTATAHPLHKLAGVLKATTSALGFDDSVPRQPRVMALAQGSSGTNTPPTACAAGPSAPGSEAETKPEVKGICNYYQKKGHYWRDCRSARGTQKCSETWLQQCSNCKECGPLFNPRLEDLISQWSNTRSQDLERSPWDSHQMVLHLLLLRQKVCPVWFPTTSWRTEHPHICSGPGWWTVEHQFTS